MSGNQEILSSNSKPTPASPHAASTAISGHADRHKVTMDKEFGEYKIKKSDPFQTNAPKVNNFMRRLRGGSAAPQGLEVEEGTSQDRPIEVGDSPTSSSSEALSRTKKSPVSILKDIAAQSITMLRVRAPDRAIRSRSRTVERITTNDPKEADNRQPQRSQENYREGADMHLAVDIVHMEGDTLVDTDEPQLPEDTASPMHMRSSPPPMDYTPSSHSSTSAELEPKTDPPVATPEAE